MSFLCSLKQLQDLYNLTPDSYVSTLDNIYASSSQANLLE